MADTGSGKDGRLGPYRLGRRHGSKDPEMEGELCEARNEHTDAPALVLVSGPDECGKPEEEPSRRIGRTGALLGVAGGSRAGR
ncbi:MAG TPA: hypothetical protein VEU33_49910 [Archangium sp.]|nr:hypothetical protein [Archangium sp.]